MWQIHSAASATRDAALLTLAYRHGLRVSELVALRWDMIDLKQGLLHVNRLKNGISSVHPLRGPELRALCKLSRDYPGSPYVFVTERKGPLSTCKVSIMTFLPFAPAPYSKNGRRQAGCPVERQSSWPVGAVMIVADYCSGWSS